MNGDFADAAQDADDHIDEADVEHGHDEVDCAEVARARRDVLPASLADLRFGRNAESSVQHTVRGWLSVDLVKDLSTHQPETPSRTSHSLQRRTPGSCPSR